jgi:hypothetical protein
VETVSTLFHLVQMQVTPDDSTKPELLASVLASADSARRFFLMAGVSNDMIDGYVGALEHLASRPESTFIEGYSRGS